MNKIIEKINQINFYSFIVSGVPDLIDLIFKLGSVGLSDTNKKLFRNDLDYLLHQKGRFLIHNTFAGGIIFLREPETIKAIEIRLHSGNSEVDVLVEYGSEKRNARNVKYKPNAGQIESTTWNMGAIFPNFNKHSKDIKIILMAIIGKMVKDICERHKKQSWFMCYEKPFDLRLFLDGKLELIYRVDIE
jgi:hypothetical protein